MTDRRAFLSGMLAAGLCPQTTWAEAGSPDFLSAGLRPNGSYVLCGLNGNGEIVFELPLPDRGHAAAAHPTRAEAVAFARRPGTFALVIDCATGRETARLHAPADRHFYGHGTFSDDGDTLFTTENDYESGEGIIGIWDARNGYQRIGEFFSGGTGPHDMKLMPDGQTLAVANGGIETHPEAGRTKLNIPTMQPNLSYVSMSGEVVERIELDQALRKNSIRHLAVAPDGTLAFAMQWQGDVVAHPPLLGLHRRGSKEILLEPPDRYLKRLVGYVGSVAISKAMDFVAATSPRGGVVHMYATDTGDLLSQIEIEDVCGVAQTSVDFFLTSGLGKTFQNVLTGEKKTTEHAIKWDNHLIPV